MQQNLIYHSYYGLTDNDIYIEKQHSGQRKYQDSTEHR